MRLAQFLYSFLFFLGCLLTCRSFVAIRHQIGGRLTSLDSMSSADAFKKAKELVGDSVDDLTLGKIAITFALDDAQKEREQEQLKNEREREQLKNDCILAYYKHKMSVVCQRAAFERFLDKIYIAYSNKVDPIFKAIESSKAFGTKIALEAKKDYPGKQILDNALASDPAIREAVWSHFGFSSSLSYPSLPEDLVFGRLSLEVHWPEYQTLLVPSDAPKEYQEFFAALATHLKKGYDVFSAEDAVAGGKMA